MVFERYRLQDFLAVKKSLVALCAATFVSIQLTSLASAETLAINAAPPTVPVSHQGITGTSLGGGVSVSAPASDTIVYEENTSLEKQLSMPVYQWRSTTATPRGMVMAVHGLAMHGKCYDYLGRSLAEQGYSVIATDMRGYGSYQTSDHKFCAKTHVECKEKTNYDRSFDDIERLAHAIKAAYPTLPLFAVGESLGGSMVIRLAATSPNVIDGVVLSAPALRHHTFIDAYVMADASLCMTNPRHQLDLTPFVRRYSSDDPRIVDEVLADPMARRHLSFYELLQASMTVHKTSSFVSRISPDMPVLVIQGGADKCVKAKGVMVLISELRSTDQTVKWFHERGHILIETSYIKSDTMESVLGWLDGHVNSPTLQAKYNHWHETPDAAAAAAASVVVEPEHATTFDMASVITSGHQNEE